MEKPCMPSAMRIDLNCADCGENRLNLGDGNEDDAVIRCGACGRRIGTLAELKERVATEVLKHSSKA
jgi:DNA-directed RNA polymerase subunit RPC12/RpoP